MKSSSSESNGQQQSPILPRSDSLSISTADSSDKQKTCIIKLQEQVRQYLDEIQTKDKIIDEMRRDKMMKEFQSSNYIVKEIKDIESQMKSNSETHETHVATTTNLVVNLRKLTFNSINSNNEIPPEVNHGVRDNNTKEVTNEKTTNRTINELQTNCDELRKRLDKMNQELVNANMMIRKLNSDQTKYMQVLMELGRLMNIESINDDLSLDKIIEALYARANLLKWLNTSKHSPKKLMGHGKTGRTKEFKECLKRKELYIDGIQIKAIQNIDKCNIDKDPELATNKILVSHNNKLTKQVEGLREEVVNLKKRYLEQEQIRVINTNLNEKVKSLTAKIEKLESLRKKQADLVNYVESDKKKAQSDVMELSVQLKSALEELDLSKKREKQMLQLRTSVSCLLGLDLNTLTMPNYEIVNRLEKLIIAYRSNVYTTYSMDSKLHDINQSLFQDRQKK